MAYPFQEMDTQKLIKFWEVLLYKKETNQNDTFDTSKQTDKLSRNKHTRKNKSLNFRPQRQRKI